MKRALAEFPGRDAIPLEGQVLVAHRFDGDARQMRLRRGQRTGQLYLERISSTQRPDPGSSQRPK